MYSSKLSISKRFSMSVTWNILCILPCSVKLRFTSLLKNQVEWIFRALLSYRYLYVSCWFSWDILSLTKSPPKTFRLPSSWDLLPRVLRLYIIEFFCLRHLNFTMTLSRLFIRWQAYQAFGTTFTSVYDKALQTFSSKTSSVMSAGTWFKSIFSLLLYWEFATALWSSCIILVSKCELSFLHCCNSELTLSYFHKKSLNFSSRLLSFILISLTKLELISVSSWMSSSLLIFSYWLWVKTILKFIFIYKSKNILKINLKMAEAWNDVYPTAFIRGCMDGYIYIYIYIYI